VLPKAGHGWLGDSLPGGLARSDAGRRGGAHAAWLFIQRADQDSVLQRAFLDALRSALAQEGPPQRTWPTWRQDAGPHLERPRPIQLVTLCRPGGGQGGPQRGADVPAGQLRWRPATPGGRPERARGSFADRRPAIGRHRRRDRPRRQRARHPCGGPSAGDHPS